MFHYALLITAFLTIFTNQLQSAREPVPFVVDNDSAMPSFARYATKPSEQMDDIKVRDAAHLVDVAGEPSCIIHGCINAITGTIWMCPSTRSFRMV